MQLKVMFLLFILVFYSSVTLFYGFYGDLTGDENELIKYIEIDGELVEDTNGVYTDTWVILTDLDGTAITREEAGRVRKDGFFSNAITGIENTPNWINLLVFIPLLLALIYLLLPTY